VQEDYSVQRLLGSALTARRCRSQCQELSLRAISHKVMILWRAARGLPESVSGFCSSTEKIILTPFSLFITRCITGSYMPAGSGLSKRARI
jgi:hypothetical protein